NGWGQSTSLPDDELAAVEGFGMAAGCVALHSTHAQEGPEEILREPALAGLAWEAGKDHLDFPPTERVVERYEDIRRPEVAVVLGDLVFENELVSEGVPRELGDQPVVLMEVVAVVGEHEVRGSRTLELLEGLLDSRPVVRQEPITEFLDDDLGFRRAAQEPLGAAPCLVLSLCLR